MSIFDCLLFPLLIVFVASHAPPPATAPQGQSGSLVGSIGSTISQGQYMAFGAGSEVAHRAVEAVMGPRTIKHETVVSEATGASSSSMGGVAGSNACKDHSKAFEDVSILSHYICARL
ncbi:hypothetical protein ACHQM5_023778 [Ranunculus cassubicifolius]